MPGLPAPVMVPAPPAAAQASHVSGLERVAEATLLLFVATLPWAIAPMSISAALCGAVTLMLWLRRRPRELAPVWAATLAWFAAHLLAAGFALDPAASWPRVTKGLMPAIVLVTADLARPARRLGRPVAVLLVSAGLAAVFGLVVFVSHGGGMAARARGAVGHYMTFGGQLLLVGSLAAGIVVATRAWRWRLAAAGVLAVTLAALGATFTRSAWIGFGVSLATMCAVRRPRWTLPLLAALAVAVALAPAPYRARALSAFDPHHPANLQRTYMWQAGVRMFRDHPLTGVGLEDLKPVYDRYKVPGATERAGHLHSIVFQIAATMGLVGLLAFVWLYGSLVRVTLIGLGRSLRDEGLEAGVRLGVLGTLAGFLVAGMFEWNFGDEELLYLLFTLVGLAWAARPQSDGLPAAAPRSVRPVDEPPRVAAAGAAAGPTA